MYTDGRVVVDLVIHCLVVTPQSIMRAVDLLGCDVACDRPHQASAVIVGTVHPDFTEKR